MNLKNLYILLISLITFSCTQETIYSEGDIVKDGVNLNIASSRLSAENTVEEENAINNITAYHFNDNVLKEVIELVADNSGNTKLRLKENTGSVYFIANKNGINDLESVSEGHTTLTEFLGYTQSGEEMKTDGLIMTASVPVTELHDDKVIQMQRSVGRIDIETKQVGVFVKEVILENSADKGFILGKEEVSSPENVNYTRKYTERYEQPLCKSSKTIAYVYEQANSNLKATVIIESAGGEHILRANLPSIIKRNTVYSLRVKNNGAGMTLEVIAESDWDNGNGSDSELVNEPVIDRNNSDLGNGVILNETTDTLFIPHTKNDFYISLLTRSNENVIIEGNTNEANANIESTNNTTGTRIHITNRLKMPGEKGNLIYLQIMNNQENRKRAVLVFKENPITLENTRLKFNENGVSNFNDYADGDFGTIILPEGANIKLEFKTGEDKWIKLDTIENKVSSYRILGGWKPNDPKADGRLQEATLVITQNGLKEERYTIQRKNHALPVVRINGIWWCKYNLIGNVKRFEDQISIEDDKKIGNDLFSYLQNCSNEDFYRINTSVNFYRKIKS